MAAEIEEESHANSTEHALSKNRSDPLTRNLTENANGKNANRDSPPHLPQEVRHGVAESMQSVAIAQPGRIPNSKRDRESADSSTRQE